VTGFTLGHSITLSAGVLGFTPSVAWFIPLVETGIALSIILAAVYALSTTDKKKPNEFYVFVATAIIGMLHGLGFSFMLKEILGVNPSNIWISLLSFNIGVELGQLVIVLLVWPLLIGFIKQKPDWKGAMRWAVALPCIAIASVWTGQRAVSFLNTFQTIGT